MLRIEEVNVIAALARKGRSVRSICRLSGHARQTVGKYLKTPDGVPGRRPRLAPPSKLEPFKTYLEERLQAPGWTAKALLSEVQHRGYRGGYAALRRYLRPHRAAVRQQEFEWMLAVLQGALPYATLVRQLGSLPGMEDLLTCLKEGRRSERNRALAVLARLKGIGRASVCAFLHINRTTFRKYCKLYREGGAALLLAPQVRGTKKSDQDPVKHAVFALLHSPPAAHGINRTTWRMEDLQGILRDTGQPLSRGVIRTILQNAGYKWRNARRVLTSRDPEYRTKVDAIKTILAGLQEDEAFLAVDEYGPFAVRKTGGLKRLAPGDTYTVPQWQKSRGSLILTGALELARNQVTHFYSPRKDTAEMIKMMDLLRTQYRTCRTIYLSWDAASWHISKELFVQVEARNQDAAAQGYPMVKTAPLPVGAQFLNVIESVFSGMARAVIHNSDYPSVDAAKGAIDRHFAARNQHFALRPRRAGQKIWGEERAPSAFSEGHNCKDPLYR